MLHAEESVIKHNHAAADLASRFFQDDFYLDKWFITVIFQAWWPMSWPNLSLLIVDIFCFFSGFCDTQQYKSLGLFDFYCWGVTLGFQVQVKWRCVGVLSRTHLTLTFVETRLYILAAVTAVLLHLLLKGHLSLSLMFLKCFEWIELYQHPSDCSSATRSG